MNALIHEIVKTMSLSAETVDTVKKTIPFLQENAVAITTRMYDILFSKYPETKAFFEGAPEDQPKILASAVAMYAMNIDNLGALSDKVGMMAKKHVSKQVLPEHYPIVGECLLEALDERLGEASTPEIINAWKEAYFFLADILIGAEKALYAEQS